MRHKLYSTLLTATHTAHSIGSILVDGWAMCWVTKKGTTTIKRNTNETKGVYEIKHSFDVVVGICEMLPSDPVNRQFF
jgi:hypothetical protein